MQIGIVGCGYVFDHYMSTWAMHPSLQLRGVTDIDKERAETVAGAYKLRLYESNEKLCADPEIRVVVNLTSIESHYDVTRAALLAGKHVYSEKPLTTDLARARELFELAEEKGLILSCAPCNALSDSLQTAWKAVLDGAIGRVRLVYAELDDNPIYLMSPEGWRSKTGAPWPYIHEYEQGCTHEHVGYHLTWLCSMFGPAESVTSFSKCLVPDKTALPMSTRDTPDFSVACINFRSGVVARVTCSIVAPLDHRIRILGDRGMVSIDTHRDYQCPVYLERFSKLTLNARKARSVRTSGFLQGLFGVGGRRQKLVKNLPPGAGSGRGSGVRQKRRIFGGIGALKKRELGVQDKCLGVAELVDAIENDRRPYFPPHDFTLHVTELTLAIQRAGMNNSSYTLTTAFDPIAPRSGTLESGLFYNVGPDQGLVGSLIDKVLARMHQH